MSFTLLLASAISMSLLMGLAWAIERRTGNSGWIDPIWSLATGVTAIGALLLAEGGEPGRRLLAIALVGAWSLRLGLHIAARNFEAGDDPRYKALRDEWGPSAALRMALFLQSQAVAGFILVIAVLAAALNPSPFLHLFDILAALLALGALAGESISDRQLAKYRAKRIAGGVMEEGLWAYSRHPNYFFEWLFWCSWPVMALAGWQGGWVQALSLLAPAMMYYLLVHVSGLPPLETHMEKSRGEKFRALQRRVNAFFPGPRRTG